MLGCPLPHDLRSLHNLAALSHVGVDNLPACDENLRAEVALIFPQLCIFYTLAQCTRPACLRLHMCKDWLRTGRCSSLCQLSHNFTPRERNILNAFQVQVPSDVALGNMSPRGIQAILANVICPDGTYVKLTTCNCSEEQPMTKQQLMGTGVQPAVQKQRFGFGRPALLHLSQPEDELDFDDYENDAHSMHSQSMQQQHHTGNRATDSYPAVRNAAPAAANHAGARQVHVLNQRAANHQPQSQPQQQTKTQMQHYRQQQPSNWSSTSSAFQKKDAADQNNVNPYYEDEESSSLELYAAASTSNSRWIPPPVRAAAAEYAATFNGVTSAEHYGNIKNVSAIIKYLIRRGGWAPWRQFTADFNIPLDFFELQKWLFARQLLDSSYTGARAEWIRAIDYDTLHAHTRKTFDNRVPEEVCMFTLGVNSDTSSLVAALSVI